MNLGAVPQRGGSGFRVWAPRCRSVSVERTRRNGKPLGRPVPLERGPDGYYSGFVRGARPGDLYVYVLDGERRRPDPVSRHLPRGVHGPSEIVDPSFRWTARRWRGLPMRDLVFYEAHIGTFTREGTFDAACARVPYLKGLGVTCLEIMPVAQFPGARNWGYDGASLFAPQSTYGGPAGLKRLVDRCHREGIAVCLDVVYNHFGPEGNYLAEFGPYFTERHKTPWGPAVNYDGPDCGPVRDFVIANAMYWIEEFRVDALRLDAIHAIYDFGARHILEELDAAVKRRAAELGRTVCVIAESDLNDSRVVRPRAQGGHGLDAQWSDDFHHALHAVMTGESAGYYEDFGAFGDLAKAVSDAFVYDGRYSAHRRRRHGNRAADLPGERFVVSAQNHDQVGNRAWGDRLAEKMPFERQKLAAAALVLSPFAPLIFMGQEYGETAPFRYFVDHGDPQLVEAVRRGRLEEFRHFGWDSVPDPGSSRTFLACKLDWTLAGRGGHALLLALHRDLLRLRRSPLFRGAPSESERRVAFAAEAPWLAFETGSGARRAGVILNFSDAELDIEIPFRGARRFDAVLNTADRRYGGDARSRATYRSRVSIGPCRALAGRVR